MPKTTKTPRREAHGAARPTRDGLDGTAQFTCAGCPPGILRPGRSLRPPRKRDSIQRSSALSVYGPPCPKSWAGHVGRQRKRPVPGERGAAAWRSGSGGGFGQVVCEVAGLVGVDRDAGAHRGGEGDLPQVPALGRGGLEPDHLVQGGAVVLQQGGRGERRLADDEVEVAMPVSPELDLAALDVGHRLGDGRRHGPGLRVRHQAARAEHPAEPADLAHHVGGGDDRVEVEEPALDALDHVVGADEVGTRGAGILGPVADGEYQDPGRLAGPVRQVDRAADHLVLLARVDAEPQGHLDGRVELRHLARLGDVDRLGGAVEPLVVDLLVGLAVRLAALHIYLLGRSWSADRARPCHCVLDGDNGYFSTLMPIERAVPAMIFSAASIVVAFRSGILVCAMSRTWAAVMLPTLVLCGSALPLSTPAAFLKIG